MVALKIHMMMFSVSFVSVCLSVSSPGLYQCLKESPTHSEKSDISSIYRQECIYKLERHSRACSSQRPELCGASWSIGSIVSVIDLNRLIVPDAVQIKLTWF